MPVKIMPKPASRQRVFSLVALSLLLATACHKPDSQGNNSGNASEQSTAQRGSENPTSSDKSKKQPDQGTLATTSPIKFVEIQESAGVEFIFRNGEENWLHAMIEATGGGLGFLDFDRDGRNDLFLTGGGGFTDDRLVTFGSHGIYRNKSVTPSSLGPSATEPLIQFDDVSQATRASVGRCYSFGVNVGDYDQDGFCDVHITGYGGQQLFRNLGDGTFDEVTHVVQLNDTDWSAASAWCDIDLDGLLDIYISHYAKWNFDVEPVCVLANGKRDRCFPYQFEGEADELYRQSPEGVFENVNDRVAVESSHGLGVLAADFDTDGDIDFYVANDEHPNFYFKNDNARFTEYGIRSGTAIGSRGKPDGSMGIAGGDYDGNGFLDLLVTNFQNEYCELFSNQGRNFFHNATAKAGLTILGSDLVGWGAVFFDGDLDGDEDLFVVAGHTARYPDASSEQQKAVLLENQNKKRFQRLGTSAGEFFNRPLSARGLALGDLDADGDLDGAITALNQPMVLLQNQTKVDGHFLEVDLVGVDSNRDAFGAIVTCQFEGASQVRHRFGGGSFESSNAASLHFGFPASAPSQSSDSSASPTVNVEVRWPNGQKTLLENVTLNQRIQIVEGESL